VVADRDGIVLARNPLVAGRIGDKIPYPQVLQAVLAGREGELEAKGQGGVERLIAYNSVAENPDGEIAMRVLVSVPLSVILADANHAMRRDLAGILVATVLLMIGAWYGAEVFVLRNIRMLLDAAKHIQAGRLSARTGAAHGNDELAQLGAAFDNMARALQQRDADLHRAMQELQQQAITDALTGLYNRRYLYEILPRELMLARRNDKPVAVLMIDIDDFKRVNDTYGHEAGDRVLQETAQLIKAAGRGSDYSCRYGGEEFLLVLPDSPIDGAQLRAESIRAGVQRLEVVCADGKRISVTLSIGVAVFPEHGADADTLLRVADEALYAAKHAGRNRVVAHAVTAVA
jgi:diguanylate cyclase (GGDEF)-like protein